jgi:N-acetylglutamate synthase-like GNAT family acetyltransferase
MTTTRAARASEAGAIQRLVHAAYEHYPAQIGVTPAPMTADYAALVATGDVHVAEQDGSIVGVLVLESHPEHLQIENVAVAPHAQGQGIGGTLLALAEREAADRGLVELRLLTHERMTENIAYYSRRGYVETHRTDDGGFHRVHFAKTLTGAVSSRPSP